VKTMKELCTQFKCDKGAESHHYYEVYDNHFSPRRNDEVNVLEIGIWHGTSFDVWHEYFPNANIYGIDIFTRLKPEQVPALKKDRVHYLIGDSTKADIADKLNKKWNDIKFDFIIDDGLHDPQANRLTFKHLFPFLQDEGQYFIEDAWPLHIMTSQQLNHSWLTKHPDRYNHFEMEMFLEEIEQYKTEEFDLRSKGNPDSYIFKVTK